MAENNRARETALIRAGLVGAAMIFAAAPAVAADWHLNASVTEEFTYDSNFSLDPDDDQELWGFNTRPRVGFETHTPRTDINLGAVLNYGYFPDRTSENSFDQAGNASLSHRSERSTFAVGANVNHATTRTTEDEDTGRDFSDAEVLNFGGNASWSYALTETLGAGIQGGGSYVTYDTDVLDDYRTFSVGPFATVQLTEQDSVRFNAIYTNYETLSGLDNSSDLYLGNAVWTHVFHPQWEMSIRAGVSYTDEDEEVSTGGGGTRTQSNTRWAGDGGITLTYTEERASISGGFSHAMVPSGDGALVLRNSLDLTVGYRVTPLISMDVKTSFIQQSGIQGDADDRNFVAAEPGITWNFLPDWTARVAYKFRTQELEGENRAYSNGARASISWKLPGWGPGQGK